MEMVLGCMIPGVGMKRKIMVCDSCSFPHEVGISKKDYFRLKIPSSKETSSSSSTAAFLGLSSIFSF